MYRFIYMCVCLPHTFSASLNCQYVPKWIQADFVGPHFDHQECRLADQTKSRVQLVLMLNKHVEHMFPPPK